MESSHPFWTFEPQVKVLFLYIKLVFKKASYFRLCTFLTALEVTGEIIDSTPFTTATQGTTTPHFQVYKVETNNCRHAYPSDVSLLIDGREHKCKRYNPRQQVSIPTVGKK